MLVHMCSQEQVGVLYLLIKKHSLEALEHDSEGNVNVRMEDVSD